MHKFGSTGIVTGYIKQLLASTEIPRVRIYTREMQKYFDEHHVESPFVLESYARTLEEMLPVDKATIDSFRDVSNPVPQVKSEKVHRNLYIKDGLFQLYRGGYYDTKASFVPGLWQSTTVTASKIAGGTTYVYPRGTYIPNVTKHLQLKNNIYDSYTHEYLGDYLRFIRDYDGLDLMPLYNCFSNNLCSSKASLNIKIPYTRALNQQIVLDAGDTDYRIYRIPVKLFNNYTIAIDSPKPVEICCGLYSAELATDTVAKTLLKDTYCCKTYTSFDKPFLYTALQDIAADVLPKYPLRSDIEAHLEARQFLIDIADRETDLVMFIKIPKEIDSSIVVLEGNYVGWNDQVLHKPKNANGGSKPELAVNHTVVSNEAIFYDADLTLRTPLQLLRLNTKTHIPFADRLLEYLMGQCITGADDDPREDIASIQYLVKNHYKDDIQGLSIYYGMDTASSPGAIYNSLGNTSVTDTQIVKVLEDLVATKHFHKTTALSNEVKITFKQKVPIYFFVPDTYNDPEIKQIVQVYTSRIITDTKRIDTPFKQRRHELAIKTTTAKTLDAFIREDARNAKAIYAYSDRTIEIMTRVGDAYVAVPYRVYILNLTNLICETDISNHGGTSVITGKEEYTPSFIVEFPQTSIPTKIAYTAINGVWTDSIRKLLYRYMHTNFGANYSRTDSFGYVDKDVEKEFIAIIPKAAGQVAKKTLLNINVWEDLDNE